MNHPAIVITGASSGIGHAATLALARAGFLVFAGVRSEHDASRLRSDAGEASEDLKELVEPLLLDVTDPEQIGAAVWQVESTVGERGLYGLFNNAGISVQGPLEFLPPEDLRRQLEVNLVGPLMVTQAFLPLLRRARGRIVNTGSIGGFFTSPGLGPYSMSKHAMEALSDALRRELRPWGMEVSLLEPGAIATEIWDKGLGAVAETRAQAPPEARERYGALIDALERFGKSTKRRASPAELVARDVVHAFTARRPKTRYLMGNGARQRKLISKLPDRLADLLVGRALGWS